MFDDIISQGKKESGREYGSILESRFWQTFRAARTCSKFSPFHARSLVSRSIHSSHSRRRSCEKAHRDEFCRVHFLTLFTTRVDDPPLPSSLR